MSSLAVFKSNSSALTGSAVMQFVLEGPNGPFQIAASKKNGSEVEGAHAVGIRWIVQISHQNALVSRYIINPSELPHGQPKKVLINLRRGANPRCNMAGI